MIQRCFRSHYAPIALLQEKSIKPIPHRQWELLLINTTKIVHKKQNSAYTKSFESALSLADHTRSQLTAICIPYFNSVGKRTAPMRLPSYQRETLDSFNPSVCYGRIGLTNEAWEQFKCMPKVPIQTKQELDTLVKLLYNEDLISWEITEGCCFARADMAIRFLILMGIPESCIQKQYVLTHSPARSSEQIEWNYYHVAPLIQLADGSQWIIDPALNRLSALSFDDWVRLQPDEIKVTPYSIDAQTSLMDYFSHPTGAVALKMPHNYQIHLSDDRRSCRVELDQDCRWIMDEVLAKSREIIEFGWANSCLR